jgi:hypothetical protein
MVELPETPVEQGLPDSLDFTTAVMMEWDDPLEDPS